MKTYQAALPFWSTTVLSLSEGALPSDATALLKHLDHCKVINKPLFAAHCAVEKMHGFVVGRFVTTLVLAFVLIGSYSLVV